MSTLLQLLIVLLGICEAEQKSLRGKSAVAPASQLWKTTGNQSGAKMYEWLPSNIRAAAQPYNNDPKAMGINAAAARLT